MPVFMRNLGLQYLVDRDVLKEREMLDMFERSEPLVTDAGIYRVYRFRCSVELVFKTIPTPNEMRIVGTDTHYVGASRWCVLPIQDITTQSADSLSAIVAFSDLDQEHLCVTHIVKAYANPPFTIQIPANIQLAAFPFELSLYPSRAFYEKESRTITQLSSHMPYLHDGQLLPIGFLSRQQQTDRMRVYREDLMIGCGTVVGIKSENCDEVRSTGFLVATIETSFGTLEVVYTPHILDGRSATVGSYLVFSGLLSAELLP